jgi:hypothetical protein
MRTISILPASSDENGATYRAVAGNLQSVGRTAGEALDALTAQLGQEEGGTLAVVQHLRPDCFFTGEQQRRLEELMARWRQARDARTALPTEEQAELDALVESEVRAAGQRAAALVRGLAPSAP